MKLDKHKTNVSFYLATYPADELDEQPSKEVIAVFVDEKPKDDIYYSCYVSLGGHTTCSQSFLAEKCKKITDREQYQELFNELTQLGYNLKVI